jgi:hypothetical protein
MTRREYIVGARHKQTGERRSLRCWGDNGPDAMDHARHALDTIGPAWSMSYAPTGAKQKDSSQ